MEKLAHMLVDHLEGIRGIRTAVRALRQFWATDC